MDPDGKNVRRVFEKSADRRHPVWSSDGKHIAYTKIERGEWLVHIATIDGREEEEVAIGSLSDWSPDDSEIVFLSGAFDEPRRISLLKVRSRKQTFLPFPKVPMWVRSPVWSPNGEKIAFAWKPEGFEVETIYIMNRDGTEVQQIVAPQGSSASEPAWAPAGNALLYIQADDGDDWQIFKRDLESDETIQLTHIGAGHHLGSWFDPAFALPVSPQPQLLTTMWAKVKQ
jgi:Tol biopolymer transport system component